MKYYIIDDDFMVIKVLENIIECEGLGEVVGYSTESASCLEDVIHKNPDILLVDMLMPQVDGIQLVEKINLNKRNPNLKVIMISQVATKSLISKAYNSGIEFFINKPINKIEVTNVIEKLVDKIELEKKFKIIEEMFKGGSNIMENANNAKIKNIKIIFSKLGIMGEKGAEDIIKICQFIYDNNLNSMDFKVRDICEKLNDNPKAMEQRLRRAINKGLINIANVGIEDYMNENFIRYSNSLYDFENVKAEMDYIRGKRSSGGKISIKRFIDNLILMSDH